VSTGSMAPGKLRVLTIWSRRMAATVTRAKALEASHSAADERIIEVVESVMEPIVEWMELGSREGRKNERMDDPTKAREEARSAVQWNGAMEELLELMESDEEEKTRERERLESVKEEEGRLMFPLPGEDKML